MNFLTTTIFLFLVLIGHTQIVATQDTNAFAHLNEVNKEWQTNRWLSPEQDISFANDVDRIQFHLISVVEILKQRKADHLSEGQRIKRITLLDTLLGYAQRKVFPTNTDHLERTPYFIDAIGVHCAVGYLMKQSGNEILAGRISTEHNFDYIRNIRTKGVSEWATDHGFTLDELAWIQPGYPRQERLIAPGGGTNGAITKMVMDSTSGNIYAIGTFDTIGLDGACSQIALFQYDKAKCLQEGLHGNLRDLAVKNGAIYVVGEILNEGETYSVAIYTDSSWKFLNVPGREGLEARKIWSREEARSFEVVIDYQGNSELWRFKAPNQWTHIATANGSINSIASSPKSIVYAGKFDQFTIHSNAPDTLISLEANNNIVQDFDSKKWFSFDGDVSEEILTVKWRNDTFFFSEKDKANRGELNKAFGILVNDTIVPLSCHWCFHGPGEQAAYAQINDFEVSGDSVVTIVGKFYASNAPIHSNWATLNYKGLKNQLAKGFPADMILLHSIPKFNQDEVPQSIFISSPMVENKMSPITQTTIIGGNLPRFKNIFLYQPAQMYYLVSPMSQYIYAYYDVFSSNLKLQGGAIKSGVILDKNDKIVKKFKGNFVKCKLLPNERYSVKAILENGKEIRVYFYING
ncbi:MAG: hypothetical protein Crog4KO_13020 [Crocinitomicaceae bacterium]